MKVAETGLCYEDDPEIWFSTKHEDEAIRVCGQCVLQDQCQQYALEHRIEFGTWGGVTEAERAEILITLPPLEKEEEPLPAPVEPENPPRASSICGVTWNRWRDRWQVCITVGGKRQYGGYFTRQEEAEAKALALHEEYGTSPQRNAPGCRKRRPRQAA